MRKQASRLPSGASFRPADHIFRDLPLGRSLLAFGRGRAASGGGQKPSCSESFCTSRKQTNYPIERSKQEMAHLETEDPGLNLGAGGSREEDRGGHESRRGWGR